MTASGDTGYTYVLDNKDWLRAVAAVTWSGPARAEYAPRVCDAQLANSCIQHQKNNVDACARVAEGYQQPAAGTTPTTHQQKRQLWSTEAEDCVPSTRCHATACKQPGKKSEFPEALPREGFEPHGRLLVVTRSAIWLASVAPHCSLPGAGSVGVRPAVTCWHRARSARPASNEDHQTRHHAAADSGSGWACF